MKRRFLRKSVIRVTNSVIGVLNRENIEIQRIFSIVDHKTILYRDGAFVSIFKMCNFNKTLLY